MKTPALKFRYTLYHSCGKKTTKLMTEAKFKSINGIVCNYCKTGELKEYQQIFKRKAKGKPGVQLTIFDL